MVRIRMQRTGRKNRPFYRIQVLDRRTRRDGAAVEQLGWYNPLERDASKAINLNEERVRYWLSVGAQPSGTVRDMLGRRNLIDTGAWEADRARDRKRVEEAKAAAAAAEVPAEGKAEEKKAKEGKPEAAAPEAPKAEESKPE